MRQINIRASLLSLLLLLQISGFSSAQDSETIHIVGSRIANALIAELADAHGTEAIDINTTGTASGIDRFCNGELDMATAARPMTSAEAAICNANEVVYSEFLVGHQIVAFIVHPDVPVECLSEDDLQEVLKPTASNTLTDWSFYDDESELPLTVILPPDNRIEHVLVDDIVVGDGLRLDGQSYTEASEAIAQVSETAGAFSFVPWAEELADNESIQVLEVRNDVFYECVLPSAENVENEQYSVSQSLFVYVNRAWLDAKENLESLVSYLIDESNAALIEAAGITAPSAAAYTLNADVLENADAARIFSGEATEFELPDELSGSVTIVGAANAFEVIDQVANRLSIGNDDLEFNFNLAGLATGLSDLCNDEADIALLDSPLAEESLATCAENEVLTFPLNIGTRGTVLIANAADDHTACLTTEQINTVWRAESTDSVSSWSDVDDNFPEQKMTLFGLSSLDEYSDILLQIPGSVIAPVRRDTEQDYDPLYRAAAVGNVPGAITYMSWLDYQDVLENNQANIQLVAVDAGDGCIIPAPATLSDHSYALSRSAGLLVREQSMANINVQALLWSLFDEDNWFAVERGGFVGLSEIELPAIRLELQSWFTEAEAKYPPTEEPEEPEPEDDSDEEPSE